jgi:hypothetical protein
MKQITIVAVMLTAVTLGCGLIQAVLAVLQVAIAVFQLLR